MLIFFWLIQPGQYLLRLDIIGVYFQYALQPLPDLWPVIFCQIQSRQVDHRLFKIRVQLQGLSVVSFCFFQISLKCQYVTQVGQRTRALGIFL